jgi:hypothetical protein
MTPIDRLVDDVARGLTAERASATLHARTMAAIASPPSQHRRWGHFALPAGVLPLALAVLFFGLAARDVAPPELPPSLHIVRGIEPLPSIASGAESPAPNRRAAPRTRANESAVEAAWRARRVASLAMPDAIVPAPIQPDDLAVPLLQLKPLATEPLTIEPISGGR